MKRIIWLIAFVVAVSAFGAATTKVGGSAKTKVGGSAKTKVSGNSTPTPVSLYNSINTTGEGLWQLYNDNSDYYAGQMTFTFAANCTVYYVDVPFTGGFQTQFDTYKVSFYNTSGDNLGSLIAASDGVAGSALWTHTTVRFTFSTPQAFTAAQVVHVTFGSVATPGGTGNTYVWYTNPSLIPGQMTSFSNVGVNKYPTTFPSYDIQMQIFGTTP